MPPRSIQGDRIDRSSHRPILAKDRSAQPTSPTREGERATFVGALGGGATNAPHARNLCSSSVRPWPPQALLHVGRPASAPRDARTLPRRGPWTETEWAAGSRGQPPPLGCGAWVAPRVLAEQREQQQQGEPSTARFLPSSFVGRSPRADAGVDRHALAGSAAIRFGPARPNRGWLWLPAAGRYAPPSCPPQPMIEIDSACVAYVPGP